MRILIIEDDTSLMNVLSSHLRTQGYQVDACAGGRAAVEQVGKSEYDAIILDIMLPDVSGTKLLQRIRRETSSTPVLILTSPTEDVVHGLPEGASDYLTKPFAFDELLFRLGILTSMLDESVREREKITILQSRGHLCAAPQQAVKSRKEKAAI
ncbi:MAG: response regulator transcription factor [Anaerovoracaceae bacterium]